MSGCESFEALRLSDGRPDIISRRLHLDNLISRLMSSEIRYLQAKLEKIQLNKKGNKIFLEIPHELCLKIINGLYLEDLLRMRLTCRSWHEKFRNLDFCVHILKRYYQMPLNYYFKRSGLDCSGLGKAKDRGSWIQRFTINRIRRENGITCKNYHIEGIFSRSISYCNSRIAIQNREIIEVHDLISEKLISFMTPTREQMNKWLLSDNYLIGLVHNPTKLLAWDLESMVLHSIRLPAEVLYLSASRCQVGIVTVSSEILIWIVGGALRKLQKTKPDINCQEEEVVAVDIFFHSTDKGLVTSSMKLLGKNYLVMCAYNLIDIVFLISFSRTKSKSILDKNYATKITVQVFVAEALIMTHHQMLYTLTEPYKYRSTLISNDNLIGMEALESASDLLYKYVTFDMNKRQFHCMEVHLHPEVRIRFSRRNHLIWRDQIFIPVFTEGFVSIQVITISKSCNEVWNEPSKNQYASCSISGPSLKHSSILLIETRSQSTCKAIENTSLPRLTYGIEIWGDDSFIVSYDRKSLKIWQFNDFGLGPLRSSATDYRN
ncbi:putative f-box domain-containing protein [Erysiphe neolycopersici]|uniref:Putative f-box domain-containing protein n=1 Tax=Erysiphe neolycopersici TaxID=212602 RepID=A0A420I125_9PEZI|nr:putative f-box domain-containing protein [Erysiphe neolycopersici]